MSGLRIASDWFWLQVISLETWMSGLAALELIGDDLSSRDALRCFGWSRMAVTDYMSQQGNWKDSVRRPLPPRAAPARLHPSLPPVGR